MQKRPLIVFLTGGLGNQLFQMANALTLGSDREIQIEWKLGRPRCNDEGLPDLMSFQLPSRVQLIPNSQYSRFVSKTTGYILRSGFAPKRWEGLPAIRKATVLLGNLVLSIHFKRLIEIVRSEEIGYSPIVSNSATSFIVGYFQTYRFTENIDTYEELKLISLVDKNPQIEKFWKLAKDEEPIVVHFRFGDYKFEDSFGIPNAEYYKEALSQITSQYPDSKIWVFSDEEKEAQKVFPVEFIEKARWFTDSHLSSAETLEIMRLGKAYVIANSTFSWWGAILSKAENPMVICPDRWFRYADEPVDLIPQKWKRVAAWS